jgi:hypothetical protein
LWIFSSKLFTKISKSFLVIPYGSRVLVKIHFSANIKLTFGIILEVTPNLIPTGETEIFAGGGGGHKWHYLPSSLRGCPKNLSGLSPE